MSAGLDDLLRQAAGNPDPFWQLVDALREAAAADATTHAILRAVAEEAGAAVPDAVLDRLGELADYFASDSVQPGRSVGLLRKVVGLCEDRSNRLPPPHGERAGKTGRRRC